MNSRLPARLALFKYVIARLVLQWAIYCCLAPDPIRVIFSLARTLPHKTINLTGSGSKEPPNDTFFQHPKSGVQVSTPSCTLCRNQHQWHYHTASSSNSSSSCADTFHIETILPSSLLMILQKITKLDKFVYKQCGKLPESV